MATEPEKPQEPGGPANSAETLWAMLDALRRKLDDNATVGRKTQQAMVQLADSLANQVASTRQRTRWLNLNSFVAYVLFTVILGAGFLLLYRVRTSGLLADRVSAQHERDAAVTRARQAETQVRDRAGAETAVWDVYTLLTTGKRQAGLSALTALANAKLSKTERAVFAELEQRTRAELVDDQYRAGLAAFRAGKFADVVANLSAALTIESKGQRAAGMHYYLGVAQLKLTQPDAAVVALEQALTADVEIEDARYYYAAALDAQGQFARARTEYDRFATKHPLSSLTLYATRRSAILARGPAVAPILPTPAAPVPATPRPAAGAATTVPPRPANAVPPTKVGPTNVPASAEPSPPATP
ncbi:MAG: hypothetical protein KBG15_12865 [Kofleriaceae bacterium]|nr:hypothetical protein [Kofleriaceae bacterium]